MKRENSVLEKENTLCWNRGAASPEICLLALEACSNHECRNPLGCGDFYRIDSRETVLHVIHFCLEDNFLSNFIFI